MRNIKQILKDIIISWDATPLPIIKERDTDLLKIFDKNIKKIIAVIGFRRVGKTFTLLDFAKKYGKENCIYINFEDERLPQRTETLTEFIEVLKELKGNKPLILLLDEIQEIDNWSTWARRINETTNYHLILSGSSSKLSSKEIPTELRGHSISLQIFPLSFKEFLRFKQVEAQNIPQSNLLNHLREYLFSGGFPEVVLSDEGLKPLIISEYYNTFVTRDIIERYKLRNPEALKDLLGLILNSRSYTYSKLANTLKSLGHKIGKGTVLKYMKWLESSFFLESLDVFSKNIKTRIQTPKKNYIVDNYFSYRLSNSKSENIGHLMEQLVFNELLRKKTKDPILEISYFKNVLHEEVDFVISSNKAPKEIIQVTYALKEFEINEREIKALIKAKEALNCQDLKIITWEFDGTISKNGQLITCIPLVKWLLE